MVALEGLTYERKISDGCSWYLRKTDKKAVQVSRQIVGVEFGER
jgi:hypothetical protein